MAKLTEKIPLQSMTEIELEGNLKTAQNNNSDSDAESASSVVEHKSDDDGLLNDNIDNGGNISQTKNLQTAGDMEKVFEIELDETCWCKQCTCCGCGQGRCKFGLTMSTIFAALLGAGLGVLVQKLVTKNNPDGILNPDIQKVIAFPGKLWIRALKLLVLPLIALMMIILPTRVKNFGRIAKTSIPFFILTSVCASIQGFAFVNIIKPGTKGYRPGNLTSTEVTEEDIREVDAILGIFLRAVPDNIIEAMANLQILGVICFFFGYGILLRGVGSHDRNTVVSLSSALLKCTLGAVTWVVWLTPIGMFSMVMSKIVETQQFFELLRALGWYILTVLIGQSCHMFIVLPTITALFARINPFRHFIKIFPATLFAFATSSSAATLPRSIDVAERANIERGVYELVLPLGAAINMDGTAQGFPIMVMFIAQLYEREISIGSQIALMLLSIVISIGTAPIPNAGMVYLVMLLTVANLGDIESDAISILMILDWLVDRIETSVNVTSDQYITKIVDKIEQRRGDTKS